MHSLSYLSILALPFIANALTPVLQQGTGFVVGTEQFFLVGVDYQPGGAGSVDQGFDPLSNLSQCQRDVYLMQQLGVNAIRTYAVNNTLNHDACMSLLAAAGIYVVLDVNAPEWQYSINIGAPWTSYDLGYMTNVLGVIQQFSSYPNVIGFFSGNEVANDAADAKNTAPYLRAVQRDMRQFIEKNAGRPIPIGYSATDAVDIRSDLAYYLSCAGDDNGHSDFYGLNSYEWCGNQNFQGSGYQTLVNLFSNLTIPIFLSEFGCNTVPPRNFGDVTVLYTSDMNKVFSGGLVYEFNQAQNNFGLVEVGSDGNAQILSDYDTLKTVYAGISLPSTPTYSNKTRPACSVVAATITAFDANKAIPAQPTGVAALISSGVPGIVPGKIIDVDVNLKGVTWTIKDVSGNVISNPTISTVSGWNVPITSTQQSVATAGTSGTSGTPSTAGATSSTAGASPASTSAHKSGASRISRSIVGKWIIGVVTGITIFMSI